jgi:hypothetical protein
MRHPERIIDQEYIGFNEKARLRNALVSGSGL